MKNFLIYKSSAGSGKTTALIGEFLKLILAEPDPSRFKQVLAITFTNKATNEMKERLTKELRNAAACTPDDVPMLTERTMAALKIDLPEIKTRARRAFIQILFDYGDLAVSTIDKFNHRLIRAFSKELNLRSDFEVDLDTKGLFREAVLRLTERTGTDPGTTAHLTAFITDRLDDENRVNIIGELEKLQPLIMSEDADIPLKAFSDFDEAAFSDVAKRLKSLRADFEEYLKRRGTEAMALIKETGAEETDFNRKSQGWFPKFAYFAAGDFSDTKKINISATQKGLAEKPMAHKDCDADLRAAIEVRNGSLQAAAQSIIDHIEIHGPAYLTAREVLRSIRLVAVLNALRECMGEIIHERNILPIAFFNRTISEELRKEPVAFIYENIGNRYRNILIDEFQDTSALQWINLLPLVRESVARGAMSLIVGDAKQSIYRWRGGKAEQLISLPEIEDPHGLTDPDAQLQLRRAGTVIPLGTNYRSCGRIIGFNNALIGSLKNELTEEGSPYREAYRDSAQNIPVKQKGSGYVEINYLGKKPEEEEDLYLPLLRQIKAVTESGYSRKDICLLVRTKKEGSRITAFLAGKDITVSTADSRSIDADVRVNLIISLMRCRIRPDHNPAKAGAMRALCTLKQIAYTPERFTGNRGLDIDAFLTENKLPRLREELFSQGAYQACENLVRTFIPEFASTAPVSTLQNYIFQKGGMRLTVRDFLREWDEGIDKPSAGTSAGADSVRMMTIHKSKGLQFPIVIVPTLNWKYKPGSDPQWIDISGMKEIALPYAPLKVKEDFKRMGLSEAYDSDEAATGFDHLNLVYVALTRAVKALFVNYHTSDKGHIGAAFHQAVKNTAEEAETRLPGAQITGLSNEEDPKSPEPGTLRWGEIPPVEEEDKKKESTEVRDKPAVETPIEQSKIPWHERFPFAYDPKSAGKNLSRRTGILFHRIAAETTGFEEAEKWLDRAVSSGELSEKEADSLKVSAQKLYVDEKYAALNRAGKRYAERDLAWQGEVLRPDLVFELEKKVVVIDFKTGERKESHTAQIRRYRDALTAAFDKPSEGYLLYTDYMAWVNESGETAAGEDEGQMRMF